MGYKTFFIKESEKEKKKSKSNNVKILKMNFIIFNVILMGTIDIYDKQNNYQYNNVLLLEDGSDDGDGYDYSPLNDDYILTSQDVKANISIQKNGYKNNCHY